MIIGLSCAGAGADERSFSGAWSDAGVWPSAGATAPNVNPPANAPPPFRRSLRLVRFEPIGLSFEESHYDEITSPRTRVYAAVYTALPNLASAHEQGCS